MTDYFAVLGLPRRPLVDETSLKAAYHRLAVVWHPDAAGGDVDKFRFLQEARRVLTSPASRLRHLLELDGLEPGGNASPPFADVFMRVGSALQGGERVLRNGEGIQSAIAKAVWRRELVGVLNSVREQRRALVELQDALWQELDDLDARWPGVDPGAVAALASKFGYLARWDSELHAMEFRLAGVCS